MTEETLPPLTEEQIEGRMTVIRWEGALVRILELRGDDREQRMNEWRNSSPINERELNDISPR